MVLEFTSGPSRPIESIIAPLKVTKHRLQRSIQHHHINHERQFPQRCWRRASSSERNSYLHRLRFIVLSQRAEPRFVLLHQARHRGLVVEMNDLGHPVEVAEAPGCETEAGDAEEGAEDLTVNFEPDLPG